MEYQIIAFMQNAWFPPGTKQRHIDKYHRDQKFHQRILSFSMSGRRLMEAFKELYFKIWWDNTTHETVQFASDIVPPNTIMMEELIVKIKPRLILGFGKQAEETLIGIDPPIPMYFCHHPNARGKTQADLNNFAHIVRQHTITHEFYK